MSWPVGQGIGKAKGEGKIQEKKKGDQPVNEINPDLANFPKAEPKYQPVNEYVNWLARPTGQREHQPGRLTNRSMRATTNRSTRKSAVPGKILPKALPGLGYG